MDNKELNSIAGVKPMRQVAVGGGTTVAYRTIDELTPEVVYLASHKYFKNIAESVEMVTRDKAIYKKGVPAGFGSKEVCVQTASVIPTLPRLCLYLGITKKEYFKVLADERHRLHRAISDIQLYIEDATLAAGYTTRGQATVVNKVLASQFDYVEKTEVTSKNINANLDLSRFSDQELIDAIKGFNE